MERAFTPARSAANWANASAWVAVTTVADGVGRLGRHEDPKPPQNPKCGHIFYHLQKLAMVKDIIKCFMCAVKGVEKTFNSYGELQDHMYKDHDMRKDPAMELFQKYKTTGDKSPSAA